MHRFRRSMFVWATFRLSSCINFLPLSNKNTKDKYLIINFLGTCAASHWRDAAALETIILRWNWENKLSSCREFGKDIVVAQKVGISYCSMAGIPKKNRIMNFERSRKFLVRRRKNFEAWQDGSDIYSTSSTLCKILIVPSRDFAAAPTDEEMSPAFQPSPVAQESLKWHKFHSCASVWISMWRRKKTLARIRVFLAGTILLTLTRRCCVLLFPLCNLLLRLFTSLVGWCLSARIRENTLKI